jgi:hypothetical protein
MVAAGGAGGGGNSSEENDSDAEEYDWRQPQQRGPTPAAAAPPPGAGGRSVAPVSESVRRGAALVTQAGGSAKGAKGPPPELALKALMAPVVDDTPDTPRGNAIAQLLWHSKTVRVLRSLARARAPAFARARTRRAPPAAASSVRPPRGARAPTWRNPPRARAERSPRPPARPLRLTHSLLPQTSRRLGRSLTFSGVGRVRHKRHATDTLLYPRGPFMRRWNICLVFLMLFTAVVTPYEARH